MNELKEIANDKEYRQKQKAKRENERFERAFEITGAVLIIGVGIAGIYTLLSTMLCAVAGTVSVFQLLLKVGSTSIALLLVIVFFKMTEKTLGFEGEI